MLAGITGMALVLGAVKIAKPCFKAAFILTILGR